MSELNLSLYHLAEGGDLLELFEMRAEALVESDKIMAAAGPESSDYGDALGDVKVIDEQITAYMAALPAKVDSVRHVWKRIEVLIQEAADEVRFQSKRGQHLKADLERLKDYCHRCMELIEWKPGKPRKLEGHSGAIYLKGNGGRPAVEVYDESLVPDELCTVTVTLRADSIWTRRIALDDDTVARFGPRVPAVSLISARLSEACPKCEGRGQGTVVLTEEQMRTIHPEAVATLCRCLECGASGKQSVPGARLKEPGTHVECK